PFAYPINLVYALRNGVSPGRYDLLAGRNFLGDPLQPFGRVDVGNGDEWVLDEGWHQPEREGAITFRWATTSAGVIIPLHHAAPLRVQVRLHAFAFPGSPEQSMRFVVNGHEHGPAPVSPGWHIVDLDVPEDEWRRGVNRVVLRFAWEDQPAKVGLGGDTRALAAAVDYIRVTIR
ncbi:MAG: hypothetical protein ACRD15_11930, partial [Vicinamibacterales bacterium]